jgi:hypothetical protein
MSTVSRTVLTGLFPVSTTLRIVAGDVRSEPEVAQQWAGKRSEQLNYLY